MNMTVSETQDLLFEEIDTNELYGDGYFIGGAAAGVIVGAAIWAGVTLT
ncbi:hypothetical protein [Streptococcus chenjunshii]|nr:hypothetical protein [Streptococcus chenjunshii]